MYPYQHTIVGNIGQFTENQRITADLKPLTLWISLDVAGSPSAKHLITMILSYDAFLQHKYLYNMYNIPTYIYTYSKMKGIVHLFLYIWDGTFDINFMELFNLELRSQDMT